MLREKKFNDLTKGPFLKKMIAFAIPLIFTGLLQSFYSAADLVVVGQFRGDITVAAVGSTNSITNLTVALFMGLSVGAGVSVAHHIGARENEDVQKVVHTSVLLALILGIIVGICGFFSAEALLEMMKTPENVLPHSTLYMRIVFLGIPAVMVYNYIASMLRSAGDSKKPLEFLFLAGIINIVLNVILVAFFGFGVDGVAIATIVSQYFSAVAAIIYLVKTEGPLHLNLSKLKIHLSKVGKLLYIGIPSGLQGALFSLSNVFIQSAINSFGDDVMAGSSASSNLEGFLYIAMNAFYHVSVTFIGQNLGARKYNNIKKLVAYSAFLVTVLGVAMGAAFLLFRYTLVGFYVGSPKSIDAALSRFWIIVPFHFICGIMDVFSGALRALNRSMTSMVISLLGACAFRIVWLQTIFKIYPTPECIYWSYSVSWVVTSLFELLFLVIVINKLLRASNTLSPRLQN